MSKLRKTAMGQMIDMSVLQAKNEETRAVGNMPMNARGDIIDSHDNVITDNTKRVGSVYKQTINNEAVERAKAKLAEQERQRQLATQPKTSVSNSDDSVLLGQEHNSTKTKSRSKKSVDSDVSSDELQQFDEFNEPNPKK